MSRKTMTRTITATTIESANVTIANGAPVMTANEPIVVNGTITEEKALKEVRTVYGVNALVTKTTETNDVYEMAIADFIKHAKKVEKPTPEQVADGKAE